MAIHQIVVTTVPGDAVTNYALDMRDVFRRIGRADVFAEHSAEELRGNVRSIFDLEEALGRGSPSDVLIYHASIASEYVSTVLMTRPERIVMVYHNITPPGFFEVWDPPFARLLEQGRLELAKLRHRVVLSIADSDFNARELRDLGYENVHTVYVPRDLDALRKAASGRARPSHDGYNVLFVGQVMPHKRPDFLVGAWHVLSTFIAPQARCHLVGAQPLSVYSRYVRRMIGELGLDGIELTGKVAEGQLAAYFGSADVFVTATEHEGFCVPLIESMRFGVPIVARAFGAVPETLGQAGIILPADASPVVMAEAVHASATDESLRKQLRAAGAERLRAFEPGQHKQRFIEILATVM